MSCSHQHGLHFHSHPSASFRRLGFISHTFFNRLSVLLWHQFFSLVILSFAFASCLLCLSLQARPTINLSAALEAAFEAGQAKLLSAAFAGEESTESAGVESGETEQVSGFGKFAPAPVVTVEELEEEDVSSSLKHTISRKELRSGRLSTHGECQLSRWTGLGVSFCQWLCPLLVCCSVFVSTEPQVQTRDYFDKDESQVFLVG